MSLENHQQKIEQMIADGWSVLELSSSHECDGARGRVAMAEDEDGDDVPARGCPQLW